MYVFCFVVLLFVTDELCPSTAETHILLTLTASATMMSITDHTNTPLQTCLSAYISSIL